LGIIIFLAAFAAEIALAVLCIRTESYHYRIRRIVRIVSLSTILLLMVWLVIRWSLSYHAFTGLLLMFTLIGAAVLVPRKDERRAYNTVRVVMKGTGMTVLIFVLTLPAIVFPEYRMIEASGEYQVATATSTYIDNNRVETFTGTGAFRALNVGLWYPENAQRKYPLIIFSHGGISSRSSNESLYHELASNGYVVCSIDHTYHSLFTTDENGRTILIDIGYLRELNREDAKSDRQQSYEYYQEWMKTRTGDISFVIDYILSEATNETSDQVYRVVDTARIGVIGHSLGGSAALGIGRMRDDVSAVIALEAPFLCDIEGVEDGEFVFVSVAYPVPLLNVYSDSSWSHLSEWPQYRQNYNLLSDTSATVFNVHIAGAGHFSLTDLALTSPLLTRMLNGFRSTTGAESLLKAINRISMGFFDCYLKGKGEFTSESPA
jgi:dienelactone hydrolase